MYQSGFLCQARSLTISLSFVLRIFVPSNRNILADILLGKASPLKKPRRSVSASPSCKSSGKPTSGSLTKSTYKDLVTQGEVSNATARRSPRKPGRKSTHDAAGQLSLLGLRDISNHGS